MKHEANYIQQKLHTIEASTVVVLGNTS